MDDKVIIRHAASTTGADYSGVAANFTATEIDNNQPPTSANFTHYVKAKSAAERTRTHVSQVFPYADPNDDLLSFVKIVTLPAAAQGELKLVQRGRFAGRPQCRNNPNSSLCRDTVTSVTAGQLAPNEQLQISANRKTSLVLPLGHLQQRHLHLPGGGQG